MPSLSGANPLSLADFNAQAGQSGTGAAVGGANALASAFAGNPAAQAQAGYLGAETGRAQAQTRQLDQSTADGQTIAQLLTPVPGQPLPGVDKIQQALAIASRNPEIAAKIPAMLSTGMQVNAARNGGDAAAADRLSAGLGISQAGNTFTGQGLDLANKVTTAHIAAGPAYAQARASENNNIRTTDEQHFQFNNTPENVDGPGGPRIVTRQQAVAGGNTPFASTAYATNKTLTPVIGANGQPAFATPDTPGVQPPQSSDQVLGRLMATGTTAAPPSTPAAVLNTAAAGGASPAPGPSPSSPSAPGAVPSTGNPIADAALRNKLGLPQTVSAPAPDSTKAGPELDAAVNDALRRNFVTPDMTQGKFTVDAKNLAADPQVRSAILARVNELTHGDDPLFRNNTNSAIEQAIKELKPNMQFDRNSGIGSRIPFTGAHPPTIRWAPPAPGTGGTTTPVVTPPTTTAAAPVTSPLAAGLAAPAAGGQPRPVAAPAAPAPQAPTPGGIPEGATATNPNTGAKVVFRNGQWAPL